MFAGLAAKGLFSQGVSYTYDDVIFHPGIISFGADQVCCCAARVYASRAIQKAERRQLLLHT